MDSDKAVTAAFNEDKTLIYGISSFNATLFEAYSNALTGNIIQTWGADFTETFNLTVPKTVRQKSGFNQ